MSTEMSTDIFKAGLDDARARHGAVVNLILFTDTQALGLLRLFVPIAIATGSGAIASFAVTPAIPRTVGVGLAAVTVLLIVACWLCFMAMKTSAINMPGRGAEFWRWAGSAELDAVFALYMANLEEKQIANRALNVRTARYLAWAKRCAVGAPAVALVVGGCAVAYGL